MSAKLLPQKPEEPREEDCCGTGCTPCVFDIYRKQLLMWEKACLEAADNKVDVEVNTPVLSQVRYTTFKLECVKRNTNNANIYKFQAVELKEDSKGSSDVKTPISVQRCLEYIPGQYLILRNNLQEVGENVCTRPYTPISDPRSGDPGSFEVLIKLYHNGKMSNYIKNMREGDIMYVRGPYGNFVYSRNSYRYIFMLCAGTGVAPMYPIAKAIVEDEMDDTNIRLLFTCKDISEVILRDEIRELVSFWNFTMCTYLTSGEVINGRFGECFISGRIDYNVVIKELARKPLDSVLVLICGTSTFCEDMQKYILLAGVPQMNIHVF